MNTKVKDALRQMLLAESLNELKKLYRAFALQFHPDHGGSEEAMKAINIEFTRLFAILKDRQNDEATRAHDAGTWAGFHTTTETPEEFIEIVEKLNIIPGIVVELCGSWLWISGETLKNREALKTCGCRWSKPKQMWYWRHDEDFCRKRSAHDTDIEEIRAKYGSQKMNHLNNSVAVAV